MFTDEPPPAHAVRIAVKAVPGSRKDQIVGRLGDRLKIKVSAAPEDGRANQAIRELLARELGVRVQQVTLLTGHTNAEKTIRVEGVEAADLKSRWP